MKVSKKVVHRCGTTLDALLRAVSAYYKEKGDKTTAGISLAVLDNGTFYASVGRYRGGPLNKEVVVATRKDSVHPTAMSAVEELAGLWHKVVSQPTAKDAVDELAQMLYGDAHGW